MPEKLKFATALNCIDGRVQKPVYGWVLKNLGVDFVDMVTEPGIDLVVSHGDRHFVEELRRFVGVSVQAHGSKTVVIAGHSGCAANPAEREAHFEQIKNSVMKIKEWGFDVDVIGLWVSKDWQVEEVC